MLDGFMHLAAIANNMVVLFRHATAGLRWKHIARALLLTLAIGVGRSARAADLEFREVSFQSSGYRLFGTVSVPVGKNVVAGIVIIPGSGPVDRDGASRATPSMPAVYRQWAERLGAGGYVVLRYDKRNLSHPSLDIRSFDQEAQITDAVSAVSFFRTLPELAAKPIFVVGHSEGGTLAPLVAERAKLVAGVVIINSIQFPVDELIAAQLQAQPAVSSDTVAQVRRLFAEIKNGSFPREGLLLGAGANYWAQWINYSGNSPSTLSRLPTPVLLVQCLNDETLPGDTLARNIAILRAIVSKTHTARLRELQGHDHFGISTGGREPSSEFIQVLLEWLDREARAAQRGISPDSVHAPRR